MPRKQELSKIPAAIQFVSPFANINIPLPSKPLTINRTDSTLEIAKKLDAYFDDLIRNYPQATKSLLRSMYYDNKIPLNNELNILRDEASALHQYAYNPPPGTHEIMQKIVVDKDLLVTNIELRIVKIHEIAVHAGQTHQLVTKHGTAYLEAHLSLFSKFTELSVAPCEKLLLDAISIEQLRSDLILVNPLTANRLLSSRTHKKKMSIKDYLALKHRPRGFSGDNISFEEFELLMLSRKDYVRFLHDNELFTVSFMKGDFDKYLVIGAPTSNNVSVSPDTLQTILSYASAILEGMKDSIVGMAEMLAHPVDHLLIPVCQLLNDAVLILLDYAESFTRDPEEDTVIKISAKNAWTRMIARGQNMQATLSALQNGTGTERTRMLAGIATSVFLPGSLIKAAKGVVNLNRLGKFNPAVYSERALPWHSEFFTTWEKIQDRLGISGEKIPLAKPSELSSIADIRAASTASEKTFAYVIMKNGEFRAIHESLGGHARLTGGKPIAMGGDLVAKNRRIIKIDNRTGDYVPYLEHDVLKHVFNKIGASEVNMPGVIQETYPKILSIAAGMRRTPALKQSKPHLYPALLTIFSAMKKDVESYSNNFFEAASSEEKVDLEVASAQAALDKKLLDIIHVSELASGCELTPAAELLLKGNPTIHSADGWYQLAKTFMCGKGDEKLSAIVCFELAIAHDPNHVSSLNLLGCLYSGGISLTKGLVPRQHYCLPVALSCYQKAKDQGDIFARKMLDQYDVHGAHALQFPGKVFSGFDSYKYVIDRNFFRYFEQGQQPSVGEHHDGGHADAAHDTEGGRGDCHWGARGGSDMFRSGSRGASSDISVSFPKCRENPDSEWCRMYGW